MLEFICGCIVGAVAIAAINFRHIAELRHKVVVLETANEDLFKDIRSEQQISSSLRKQVAKLDDNDHRDARGQYTSERG